jgi:uncharacterized protein YjbJ (UPF0337 family)
MRVPRINPQNATGLLDKVVGLGKEIVGVAVDEDRLITAGEAQQDKGSEKLKALRSEAKAKAHRAKARTHESKERSAQSAKTGS